MFDQKEYFRAYYKKYKEEFNTYSKRWHKNNLYQKQLYDRTRYIKDPEYFTNKAKRWRRDNIDRFRMRDRKNHRNYRLRKKIFNTLNGVKIHGQKEKKVR